MGFVAKRLSKQEKTRSKPSLVISGSVLLAATFISSPVHGRAAGSPAPGLAWDVQGVWNVADATAATHTGDPVWPGALLRPDNASSAHSITVLLPDGQSVHFQCFAPKDCARGFRVPALFRAPDEFAVQMLAQIRAALAQPQNRTAAALKSAVARDETVAALGPDHRIAIAGLAAKLSNGEYYGDLKAFDARYPERSHIPLHKSGPSITFDVPGPGLYQFNISDSRNWPRIDYMIAVVPNPDSSLAKNFQRAHALMAAWIHRDLFGWPMHDFQRAYLESVMLHLSPSPTHQPPTAVADQPRAEVTAEPTFSPRPAVVSGNIDIQLHCATAGAIIHYTLSPSQPLENSPVYRAPIVMKTVPMTIKAFASAPGKKDSPVVVGTFRLDSD